MVDALRTRRVLYLKWFIGSVLFISLGFLLVQPVGAEQSRTLADKARAEIIARSLVECTTGPTRTILSGSHWTAPAIETKKAKSGDWFDESPGIGPTSVTYKISTISLVADGITSHKDPFGNHGYGVGCNTIVKSATSIFGFSDSLDLLCHITGNKKGTNGHSCTKKDSNQKFETPFGLVDGSTAGNIYNSLVERFYGGSGSSETDASGKKAIMGASSPGWYLVYRNYLNFACKIGQAVDSVDSGSDYKIEFFDIGQDGSGGDNKKLYEAGNRRDYKIGVMQSAAPGGYTIWWAAGSPSSSSGITSMTCGKLESAVNELASAYIKALDIERDSGIQDEVSSIEGDEEDVTITCSIDGVGWIVCPVMNFLADATDGAYGFIASNFLEVKYELVRTDGDVYNAWTGMRNLANALFVIVFIVIIYSQMTGMGVSNYGVKKTLPRLIVAAILVNVSFFICQLAVDLSNILGWSARSFFEGLAPDATKIDLSAGATGGGMAGFFGGLTAVVLGAALVWVFISALAPILLAALVALIMMLFILMARQALIVLLIVVSPLAFVAYMLPNTQSLFTKWRKMFMAVLLVFPITGAVFGISTLAAAVVSGSFNPASVDSFTGADGQSGSNIWGQIVGAAIMILPLFVVPGILKKSLDGVGSLGAKISGVGRGKLSGAVKKSYGDSRAAQYKTFRGQQNARRRSKVQSGVYSGRGGRMNPRNWSSNLNKKLNESAITGEFGDRSMARGVAAIADEEAKAVAEAEALYSSPGNDPAAVANEAVANFKAAAISGDTVKAKAAVNKLKGMKGFGEEKMHGLLTEVDEKTGYEFGKASNEIRYAMKAAAITSNDPVMAKFGLEPDTRVDSSGNIVNARSMSEIAADAKTYSSLTSEKIAGMSNEALSRAVKSGHVDPSVVEDALGSSGVSLNGEQRKILQKAQSDYRAKQAAADVKLNPDTVAAKPSINTEQVLDVRGSSSSDTPSKSGNDTGGNYSI